MTTRSLVCSFVEREAQPALAMRVRLMVEALPGRIGEVLGAAALQLMGHGQHPAGPPFVAYHNADMSDLDVEIGFPITAPFEGTGAFAMSEIPGGRHATCLYIGPYAGVGQAYEALSQWVAAQGCTPTGVIYESYLNDPDDTPEDALQTQILFPLRA